MTGHQIAYSGYNYWTTNKVWRPIGYEFCLGFTHTDGSDAGQGCNASQNPFAISGSYGYVKARCFNYTTSLVSPVTCQTSN